MSDRKEIKRLKRILKKKPRMPGINGLLDFSFRDKNAGKRDAGKNQICEHGSGHITPHIDDKSRIYESYVDKVYSRTALNLEPLVREANELVIEFRQLSIKKFNTTTGNRENDARQAAQQTVVELKNEKRKAEILKMLAAIKSTMYMLDESLKHHVERAEGIFQSRISRYWKGVLSASDKNLAHFPEIEKHDSVGREVYLLNYNELMSKIDSVFAEGGEV